MSKIHNEGKNQYFLTRMPVKCHKFNHEAIVFVEEGTGGGGGGGEIIPPMTFVPSG